jgi:hypothetical protein
VDQNAAVDQKLLLPPAYHRSMKRHWPVFVFLAMSCATDCGNRSQNLYVFGRARTWIFERPMDDVYQQLRALVAADGRDLPADGKPAVAAVFSTWKGGIRHSVRFVPLSDKRFRAQLQYHLESGGAQDDENILWQLIQRAEPERAAAVEAEAARRGDEAYRNQAGCEAGCGTVGRGCGAMGRGCVWVLERSIPPPPQPPSR